MITLFPVYNMIEIYHPLAERYLYLPIIGFCLVVSAAINSAAKQFTNQSTANAVILIPILVIVGFYSAATIARNPDWQNNLVLWSKTLQLSPNSLVARAGLGMAFLQQEMLDEAQQEFETAIEYYPNHAKSHYNLGVVYHRKGNLKKAVDYFNRTVVIDPRFVNAHYNLATIYHKQGLLDLAIEHYLKVTEIDPEDAEAYYRLGVAYAMQEKLDSAILAWEKVLRLDPHRSDAKENIKKAKKLKNPA